MTIVPDIRQAIKGFGHKSKQLDIIAMLHQKNIILTSKTQETAEYIHDTICMNCKYCPEGMKCLERRGNFFINKNHNLWKKPPRTRFNEFHLKELLENNFIDLPDVNGNGGYTKQKINNAIKKENNKK